MSIAAQSLSGRYELIPGMRCALRALSRVSGDVEALKPREKYAMQLVRGQGLSHRAAAAKMGIHASNVTRHLARAEAKLAELKKFLADHNGDMAIFAENLRASGLARETN